MHFHPRYLIIDTSGYHPFLAYVDSQKVLQYWDLPVGSDVGPVLEFLCKNQNFSFQGIAVAVGPGNFSATRIGLSFAQGLAMASNMPLLGYSSLEGYLTPEDKGKALMLPLGKRGGVLTLSEEISDHNFMLKKTQGVGPGHLLSYAEASEYCLAHGYYHVISPKPQLFIEHFSEKILVEETGPSIDRVHRSLIPQLLLDCNEALVPDYRSCSCFF
ncbi:tRNA threonylcarbamoyladenosine biosynthesis protein TsaB [Chlamydia pecorum]|uniref:tRNA threonylcarbamoyladenosine biosynthesis protein TsaB n=1 Tax=Chlamydia pecorum TaxID=85991 RepID=UPI0007AF9AC0|nr:tRNA (adenosine(37)-N6)-threonylcarbamoyltransferase complex dimerization subunit type 1 TsaB [Chlamydia pecorum]KZN26842.1 glycoprotease family protein [Chlamydia pecorum]